MQAENKLSPTYKKHLIFTAIGICIYIVVGHLLP